MILSICLASAVALGLFSSPAAAQTVTIGPGQVLRLAFTAPFPENCIDPASFPDRLPACRALQVDLQAFGDVAPGDVSVTGSLFDGTRLIGTQTSDGCTERRSNGECSGFLFLYGVGSTGIVNGGLDLTFNVPVVLDLNDPPFRLTGVVLDVITNVLRRTPGVFPSIRSATVVPRPDPTISVTYTGDGLPSAPWELVNNGPAEEISQHVVFAQDGVLNMVDNLRVTGNTLGYEQRLPFDPFQVIDVEFRARVLSGQVAPSCIGCLGPFEVWLHNGVVRAGLSVAPTSIAAFGRSTTFPQANAPAGILFNHAIDGTNWHTYRYRVDALSAQWWLDGVVIRSEPIYHLPPAVTSDLRINMFISSADADVQLDYLTVRQTPVGIDSLNTLLKLTDLTSTLDATPITQFPGGHYTIRATFQNSSRFDICNAFLQPIQLSGPSDLQGVWIDDTGQQIQGSGGRPEGDPFTFAAGTSTRFRFDIGLTTQPRFTFLVNVGGTAQAPGACPAATD